MGVMENAGETDGVIVEFHRVGNAVKVSAVDTNSFLEVSIMAPTTCSEREMIDTVMRKLAYVQKKGGGTTRPPAKR